MNTPLNKHLTHQAATPGKLPPNVRGGHKTLKKVGSLTVGGHPNQLGHSVSKAKGKLKHFSKVSIKGAVKSGIKGGVR